MDTSVIQSRITECNDRLRSLEDSKREIVVAHKDEIQTELRRRVSAFVASIEDSVTEEVCGDEIKLLNSQISRCKEDIEIFESALR